jgi:hypothetical protein
MYGKFFLTYCIMSAGCYQIWSSTPPLAVVKNNVAWMLFEPKLDEVGKQLLNTQGRIS